MQKFLKSIGLFLLICPVIYCILLIVWGSYAPDFLNGNLKYKKGSNSYLYTRLKEADNYGKVEVLFLGSSHTYRGFDTRIFEQHGIRSFNLGSSAQTHLQTNVLLKRYLNQLNPSIIIYEVYPQTFCSDGVESSLDIIANSTNDLESFKMVINQNHLKVYNTYIYGVIHDFFKGNHTSMEDTIFGGNSYVKGGYVTREVSYNKDSATNESKYWKFDPKQLEAFNENVALIKNKHIKLLLVQAPFTKSLYGSYLNNEVFNKKMESYETTYYNYNELLEMNDSLHFCDKDHLNQNGVDIFNEALIARMDKNGAE